MSWYTVIDFTKSRVGRVLISSAAFLVILLLLAKRYRDDLQDRERTSGTSPEAAAGHGGIHSTPLLGKQDVEFTDTDRRDDFHPMRPPTVSEPTKPLAIVPSKPSAQKNRAALPPMILSQRPLAVTKPDDSSEPGKLSKPVIDLNSGDLLHCQLVAPVSSDQKDAPVQARLTAPLIRRGRTILSSGTNLTGRLGSFQNGRLKFDTKWTLSPATGAPTEIEGNVQQSAFDSTAGHYLASDGSSGIPAVIVQPQAEKDHTWTKLLGTFASAAGRIAQDRTRTAIGDQIPASGRNALLEGASDLIDDHTDGLTAKTENLGGETRAEFPAGTRFYLWISPSS